MGPNTGPSTVFGCYLNCPPRDWRSDVGDVHQRLILPLARFAMRAHCIRRAGRVYLGWRTTRPSARWNEAAALTRGVDWSWPAFWQSDKLDLAAIYASVQLANASLERLSSALTPPERLSADHAAAPPDRRDAASGLLAGLHRLWRSAVLYRDVRRRKLGCRSVAGLPAGRHGLAAAGVCRPGRPALCPPRRARYGLCRRTDPSDEARKRYRSFNCWIDQQRQGKRARHPPGERCSAALEPALGSGQGAGSCGGVD